jgi:hypothetical protein
MSRFHETITYGETHQVAEAGEIHFLHNVIAVTFDGTGGNPDRRCHLLTDFTCSQELNDFQFAGGEGTAGNRMFRPGRVVALVVNETFDHGHRQTSSKEWLVLLDVAHSGEQFDVGIGFQDVATGAAAQNFASDVFGKVHGKDQDVGLGRFVTNEAGHFEAVHFRHGEIQEDEIGLVLFDVFNRFDAGGGFAAHFDSGLRFEQRANAATHHGVIIRYQDAIRLGRCTLFAHRGPLGDKK